MQLYIHKKCSTCKDALDFLKSQDIAVTILDIVENPPTMAELQKMFSFQNQNIKKLLNTSGLLYREMQLSTKLSSLSLASVLELLHQHGMLIKRPFLIGENVGYTGFKKEEWAKLKQI